MARLIKKTYENNNAFLDVTNLRKRTFFVFLINEALEVEPSNKISLIEIYLGCGIHITQRTVYAATDEQYMSAMDLVLEFLHENDLKVSHVSLNDKLINHYLLTNEGDLLTKEQYEEMQKIGLNVPVKADGVHSAPYDDAPEMTFCGQDNGTLHMGAGHVVHRESFKFNIKSAPQLRNSTVIINTSSLSEPNTSLTVDIELCFKVPSYLGSHKLIMLPKFLVAHDKTIGELNISFIPGEMTEHKDFENFNTLKDKVGIDLQEVPDNVRLLTLSKNLPMNTLMSSKAIMNSLRTLNNKDILFDVLINQNHNLLHTMLDDIGFKSDVRNNLKDKRTDYKALASYLRIISETDAQRILDIVNKQYIKVSDIIWIYDALKEIKSRLPVGVGLRIMKS